MANTFKKIQTVTVGSGGASSIDFTSIPQTYTDLKIVLSGRTTDSGATTANVTFNGLSTNLSSRVLVGTGSSALSGTDTKIPVRINWSTSTSSTFGNAEIYIPNYTSANNKSVSTDSVNENNATEAYMTLGAHLWSSTAAINQVTITPATGNFVQYSTATLYGVANVPAAGNAKATGGIITYDDTYVYHTFPWSGTFTPLSNLTADYLVVAGGGGAGGAQATDVGSGGGGAGGLRCTVGATGGGGTLESALSLTANTGYTVTVGAGGAGGFDTAYGTNGSNSVFSTITSTGGGGGARFGAAGSSGGSGGGGGTSGGGGAGTANQGFAGAAGLGSGARTGGGGGGAGVAGTAGSSGGHGGNGVTTSISGTSTTYAGGGGGGAGASGNGGTGGTGGGANGSNYSGNGNSATANTGGGGGGASAPGSARTGGTGGSGIVIVRYAK